MGAAKSEGASAKSKARLTASKNSLAGIQKRNETQEIFIPVGERLGNESSNSTTSARPTATAC